MKTKSSLKKFDLVNNFMIKGAMDEATAMICIMGYIHHKMRMVTLLRSRGFSIMCEVKLGLSMIALVEESALYGKEYVLDPEDPVQQEFTDRLAAAGLVKKENGKLSLTTPIFN